jgi:hypothetical protein
MSFDSGRGVTVLFGGFAGFGGFVTDTWEYDGTSWTQRMPPQAPPGRLYTAAAYDANRRRTVLFGGQDQAMVQLGDTWEYDGLTWTQITPPVAPSGRSGHSMVYDPLRRRVVLFGGSGGPAETWEYDGTAWTFVSLNPTPSPRTLHAMALDAGRGTGVLFGGWIGTNPGLGDTWELAPPACETIGPGHPGGGLAFACTTPPRVGTTFCVSWSYPPPGGVGYGLLLVAAGPGLDPPLALGPPLLCATGQLYAWPATIVPILGEPASWCVPLPAAPGLVGQAAALQGASLDAANCFRLTDGLRVWLQP